MSDTITCEITAEKLTKLQEEIGTYAAMKAMCILFDLPLSVMRTEEEMGKLKTRADL